MARCKLKGCPYNQDGRCVENQLPNCPNLVSDGEEESGGEGESANATGAVAMPLDSSLEDLYSGDKLTVEEATQILQSTAAQVVVLGGMVESGKTTLIARIFEMFQAGFIADFGYTHSRTLVTFDQLSWHATMECEGATPTTEHTYRAENNLFIHLCIRRKNHLEPPVELLISDIPGEIFPEAVADEVECRNLSALARADHLVLFLDCGILRDAAERHDHCGKVSGFVSRALQTGQIGRHTIIHLVVSKCDLLPNDEASEAARFVANFIDRFQATHSSQCGGIHPWRLAARPEHPSMPTLSEIERLFGMWLRESQRHDRTRTPTLSRGDSQRDFCRFGLPAET
jgi:hypothetical protein